MKRVYAIFSILALVTLFTPLLAYETITEDFTNQDNMADATTADWGETVPGLGIPGGGPRAVQYQNPGGNSNAVATAGQYFLCAAGGLYIYHGETTDLVGSYSSGDNEQGVAWGGRYAYLVDDAGEVEQVDIIDPASPSSSSNTTITGTPDLVDAAYGAGYLYIAAGSDGFYTIDVSDGTFGTVNNNTSYDVRGVAVYGSYLLVSASDGLYSLSLTNPGNPTAVVGSVSLTDGRRISVEGYHAYIGGWNNFYVVDVFDPSGLAAGDLTTVAAPGSCYAAVRSGDYVYAACGSYGTQIF